jgi:hypothetical protein
MNKNTILLKYFVAKWKNQLACSKRRNAGTPEYLNAGTPEHLNAGTPEHRNFIFTLKENFKKYFKFIRNFLFKIKAFQHE